MVYSTTNHRNKVKGTLHTFFLSEIYTLPDPNEIKIRSQGTSLGCSDYVKKIWIWSTLFLSLYLMWETLYVIHI